MHLITRMDLKCVKTDMQITKSPSLLLGKNGKGRSHTSSLCMQFSKMYIDTNICLAVESAGMCFFSASIRERKEFLYINSVLAETSLKCLHTLIHE